LSIDPYDHVICIKCYYRDLLVKMLKFAFLGVYGYTPYQRAHSPIKQEQMVTRSQHLRKTFTTGEQYGETLPMELHPRHTIVMQPPLLTLVLPIHRPKELDLQVCTLPWMLTHKCISPPMTKHNIVSQWLVAQGPMLTTGLRAEDSLWQRIDGVALKFVTLPSRSCSILDAIC